MTQTQSARVAFEAYAHSHDPQYFAPDAIFRHVPFGQTLVGRPAIAQLLRAFYAEAFSDAHADVSRIAVDEQSNVGVMEFVFRGRHTGEVMGLGPSGRTVEVPMLVIYELANLEITEARLYYDGATLLRQIGQA